MKTKSILPSVLLLSLICGPIATLLVDLAYGSTLILTNPTSVSTLKNVTLKTASDNRKTWHIVEAWMVNILVVLPISSYLLQSLHDVLDTFDDGSGNVDNRRARFENIRTIHCVIAKIRRRGKRIFRFFKKTSNLKRQVERNHG